MTSEQSSATKSGEGEAPTAELRTPEELRRRREEARSRRSLGGRLRDVLGARPSAGGRPAAAGRPAADGGTPGIAFLISGAVAAAYLALGLADGGFDPGVWAQATIVVWWTVLVAVLAGAWPRSAIPAAAATAGAALLAISLLSGVSMAWASDLGAAYADALRPAGYLGVFVMMAIAARAGSGRTALAGIAIGLVAIGLVALLSRLEPGLVSGADEARGLRVSGGRLSYPIGYWNALGACMAAALPLLVWLGAGSAAARWRVLATAAIPVCVLTLFFSGSRGAALATAAGIAVLLLAGPRRVPLAAVTGLGFAAAVPLVLFGAGSQALVDGAETAAASARGDQLLFLTIAAVAILALVAYKADRGIARLHLPVLGVRTAALAAVVVALLAFFVADPTSRLETLDDAPGATTRSERGEATRFASAGGSGRAQFWEAAVDAFADEPLHGIGAGGFEAYWAQNGALGFTVSHAHSLLLESAAELGVGGLLFIVAFLVIPIVAAVRRLRSPIAWTDPDAGGGAVGAALAVLAAGATSAAIEWVWEIPAALIPLVAAAAFLTVPPARSAEAPGRRRRVGAVIVVFALGVVSIVAAGLLAVSELRLEASREAVREGQPRQALEEARGAADLLPFAAAPYSQIAQVEAALGRFGAAGRAIENAEERAEEDWNLWFIEAGIEFGAGHSGRGTWALNYAAELNPKAPPELFRYPTALEAGLYRRIAEGDFTPSP